MTNFMSKLDFSIRVKSMKRFFLGKNEKNSALNNRSLQKNINDKNSILNEKVLKVIIISTI